MSEGVQLDPELAAAAGPARVPVIDMAPFRRGGAGARAATARAVGAACREIGFFYIVNHGVAAELVARTFEEAERFFALPDAVKAKIAIENSPCHRGWFRVGGENLDPETQAAGDLKEGVKIGRELPVDHPLVLAKTPLHGPNQWPDLAGWRETMQGYFAALEALGREMMRAFALALALEETYFDRWLTAPMTTLGPLHYPPQTGRVTAARLGAGAHTDYGCLTMLAQDAAGGLQVRDAGGRWLDAPPLEGSFVVNVGDMMERWTNGLFTSTRHRVINVSGRERYSLPFFFDPDFAAEVTCLPGCVGAGDAPRYAPTTAGAHLLEKIGASFEYVGASGGPGTARHKPGP